jgi:Kef-type K+ transport system membrane component KefB
VFFVASGMALDVRSIAENPLRLLVFFVLLLVVRGLPSLLVYRRALPLRQRAEMTFITATTMPLLIALAAIGLSTGVMIPANAAALVGAGVLSVLVYPSIAIALARRGGTIPAGPDAAAAGPEAAGAGGIVGAARAAGEPGAAREADAADDHGTSPAG